MTAKKRMGQCQKDGSRCETATVRYEWCGEALDRLTVYGVKGHQASQSATRCQARLVVQHT